MEIWARSRPGRPLTDQEQGLAGGEITAGADPRGFERQWGVKQAVQARGDGLDAAGRRLARQGLPDAEFEERDRQKQRVEIRAAQHADAGAGEQVHEAAPMEALALMREFAVAAAQDIESRGTHQHEAAAARDARQLARGELLLAAWKMREHVDRQREIEVGIGKRQRPDIALHQARDAERARVAEAFPAVVERDDRPAVLLLQNAGKIAGAATGLEGVRDGAAAKIGREEAEKDGAHAAVPPEVLFAGADVGELRGVHEAHGHAAMGRGTRSRIAVAAAPRDMPRSEA